MNKSSEDMPLFLRDTVLFFKKKSDYVSVSKFVSLHPHIWKYMCIHAYIYICIYMHIYVYISQKIYQYIHPLYIFLFLASSK